MRGFVDCDDTLIIWLDEDGQPLEGQNPYGGGSQKWEWNEELVRAIERLNQKQQGIWLYVWSGGGQQYAQRWVDLREWGDTPALSKDLRLPQLGDLCIDDMPIQVACPVQTWQEFVAENAR